MKQGFDDGLFRDDGRTLADVGDEDAGIVYLEDEDDRGEPEPWDPDEINALRPESAQLISPQVDYRLWKSYHATHHPHHLTRTVMY